MTSQKICRKSGTKKYILQDFPEDVKVSINKFVKYFFLWPPELGFRKSRAGPVTRSSYNFQEVGCAMPCLRDHELSNAGLNLYTITSDHSIELSKSENVLVSLLLTHTSKLCLFRIFYKYPCNHTAREIEFEFYKR